jgi:Methyltransferase domain
MRIHHEARSTMLTALRRLTGRRAPRRDAAFRNEDTDLPLEATRVDVRHAMAYRPTYDFGGRYIDAGHQALDALPCDETGMIEVGIPGWLLRPDALKLYEMAYFAPGDVLELGTYRGLSAAILARAVDASGRRSEIVSIDEWGQAPRLSAENLKRLSVPGRRRVRFEWGDAIAFVAALAEKRRRFSFVFVDHSHRYEHVLETCRPLHAVVEPGGFVQFHDYNDPRNANPAVDDYGVYQGVHDGLGDEFAFWGVFGCSGLFRRRE